MYGTKICDDCIRTKKLFDDHAIKYEFIDITDDEKATGTALKLSKGLHVTPVLLFPDGLVLLEPMDKDLIELLNLN